MDEHFNNLRERRPLIEDRCARSANLHENKESQARDRSRPPLDQEASRSSLIEPGAQNCANQLLLHNVTSEGS
jgi:hypothetical protein